MSVTDVVFGGYDFGKLSGDAGFGSYDFDLCSFTRFDKSLSPFELCFCEVILLLSHIEFFSGGIESPVNAVRCGVIDTKMHTRVDGYDEAQWRERLKLIPVGHPGQPSDVAAMVLYLLGKAGDFITGQVIAVSGGE